MPRSSQHVFSALLTPPVFDDEELTERAWLLHWLVWSVGGLVSLLILLLIPLIGQHPWRFVGQALMVVVMCAGLLALMRRGHLTSASRLLIGGLWILIGFTVLTSGGIESPAVSAFMVAIALPGLLGGVRTTIYGTVAVVIAYLLIAIAQTAGYIPDPVIAHTTWSRALAMTIYTAALGTSLVLVTASLQRARHRTEEELRERKATEDEVRLLNAELEMRVLERTQEIEASKRTLEQMVTTLEQTNIDLDAATRAKNEFLAAMSHELRTPLNSILGFSGVLLQGLAGPLTEEQRRQLAMIDSSGKRLLDLVNQVLDLSKLESGHTSIDASDFDVCDMARRAVDVLSPQAMAQGLDITTNLPAEPLYMLSDRARIDQILLNLLANAVKFTETGTITIRVRPDGDEIVFEVRDTGFGIKETELPFVFDRFHQVAPADGGKHEGSGLGLAVTRQIVELLGGTIDVESRFGSGSTFRVRLPRVILPKSQPPL